MKYPTQIDRHNLTEIQGDTDGADWTKVARVVLHRDPVEEFYLTRARWKTKNGYRRILELTLDEARNTRH